mmetsp:Transcript_27000/g.56060  ORF Transcript_27000/g.56060 Transcript_27000/m.56060 type:complete len:179 (-) Transcript_27000:94-630(-)
MPRRRSMAWAPRRRTSWTGGGASRTGRRRRTLQWSWCQTAASKTMGGWTWVPPALRTAAEDEGTAQLPTRLLQRCPCRKLQPAGGLLRALLVPASVPAASVEQPRRRPRRALGQHQAKERESLLLQEELSAGPSSRDWQAPVAISPADSAAGGGLQRSDLQQIQEALGDAAGWRACCP